MMREPSLRSSRLAIAGVLLAIAAVGGAGFFLGRTTSPNAIDSQPVSITTPVPAADPDPVTVVEPSLVRADLIEIAELASDALVAGEAMPQQVRDAVGRRFELAVPFGCTGAADEDSAAPLRWRYDENEEVLRAHVAVTRWAASDWGLGESAEIEAIEGFWIARPWTSSPQCPPLAAGVSGAEAGSPAAPGQTLAVAQFFGGDVRREVLREGRPFQTVQRVPQSTFAAPGGFRLVLSGRIGRVPGANGQGGPVRCVQPGGIEQRPICVVAVTLGELRIENPANAEVLASWPMGRD